MMSRSRRAATGPSSYEVDRGYRGWHGIKGKGGGIALHDIRTSCELQSHLRWVRLSVRKCVQPGGHDVMPSTCDVPSPGWGTRLQLLTSPVSRALAPAGCCRPCAGDKETTGSPSPVFVSVRLFAGGATAEFAEMPIHIACGQTAKRGCAQTVHCRVVGYHRRCWVQL